MVRWQRRHLERIFISDAKYSGIRCCTLMYSSFLLLNKKLIKVSHPPDFFYMLPIFHIKKDNCEIIKLFPINHFWKFFVYVNIFLSVKLCICYWNSSKKYIYVSCTFFLVNSDRILYKYSQHGVLQKINKCIEC